MAESTAQSLEEDPLTLLELLEQQRDLYYELEKLSAEQSQRIEQGQTEDLLNVLSKRQGLVEQLTQINTRLSPYRDYWGQVAQQLPEGKRQHLRHLLDEVQTLLQRILEQDETDRQQLQAARDEVGNKLQQTQKAGSAMKAYGRAAQQPRFTDSQG
jgi:flagellar biosynthesis/type III secretory pathway chaperone